ncbi:MAG: putative toxin-antitoxin system toxin component, PIN family [Candidatus Veblenbacteria bacterium RIFOXYD1_FULL_43_11]|uniref:Putative toxin-antitoxin system toxin component, PIN family n=1 Tax=Candidatus Veblenbacteria bacterium RIFOXYD1_FULL_43_11 TaxID=1802429 RepID=A0A1G2Q7E1_9BACT|nr:MAG: putative toxin-antitoxin system toxin component, PIN family [Candidatus Veblenbacteria bacterium RIFOXYD1_FULL_43_11]
MVKIVLDTNVIINAARGEGSYGKRILDLIRWGEIEAAISDPVKREQKLILERLVNDAVMRKAAKEYFSLAKMVEPVEIQIEIEDSEDIKLLELAVGAKADFLVSDDEHLLVVGDFKGVKIIKPSEFWQWWQTQQDNTGASWATWAKSVLGK